MTLAGEGAAAIPSNIYTSSTTFTVPSGLIPGTLNVSCTGESGTAGTSAHGSHSGGGSGGGAFGQEPSYDSLGGVTPGSTVLTITVPTGATGNPCTVTGGTATVSAAAGTSASGQTAGNGGAAGSNTVAYRGGNGAAGLSGATQTGGGGGGSAGSGGQGGDASSGTGGTAGPGTIGGVAGQSGAGTSANGANGTAPGGGASGGGSGGATNHTGGSAAGGQVVISWSVVTYGFLGSDSGTATFTSTTARIGSFKGYASGWLSPPVRPVNGWSATFAQPSSFGAMPPQLQSVVVPLTAATSTGIGSGTSTPGNWLFCLVTSNQNDPLPTVTFADGDDIHSWWRPIPTSPSAGVTRTSVWYTPNLSRQCNYVYVAPNGLCAALAVLVVEVVGLGPWDTVTGSYSNYANAATSLNLALAAPGASAFLIAAAGGDNDSVSQAFAPAGWTSLATVTATNSVDHTCDAVLTSACLVTSGAVSVNATTGSASDLSGVIVGVQVSAASPISGSVSAGWASRTVLEFAPGYGFESPPDEITWVTISDSARTSPDQGPPRFWGWSDKSAIPWGLGQLQSGSGAATLDNFDGNLSPSNPGGLWYSTALNENMSFQSGVSPWTAQNNATLARSSAQSFASSSAASALYSLQVTPDGATALPGAVSEEDTATAGSAYSASAWFYSAAAWSTGAEVAIRWLNSGGSTISTSTAAAVPVTAGSWFQVELLNQTAPAGTAGAKLIVQFAGTPPSVPFFVAEAALNAGASAVTTGLLTAGVPIRIRWALGTIKGVTYNRWYVISRFANSWPEKRTPKSYRGYVEAGLTDTWSIASASCATPYRGEVEVDNPGWWWPADDQPLTGGVLPTSLRNAAKGSTTVLNIVPSPSGVSSQDAYSSGLGFGGGGTDVTGLVKSGANPSVAVYAVAQSSGWMYGDPQASPQSAQTGNPVTAQPGSAAWQQSGLLGDTGANGWTLIANDTFPAIASGVTVVGWWNYTFLGTSQSSGLTSSSTYYNVAGQPYCQLTLCELATGTGPAALLYLDISGHLILETFNGGSGTTHSVYTASDLRCNAFLRVTMELTQSTYTVYLNAGLNTSGAVSGSCTISASAWSWFIANGDLGSNGGSLAGTGLQHGGNVAVSHLAIYAGLLPQYRELAQYSAAITGCGLLPAPSGMQAAAVYNAEPTGFTTDGTASQGSYGTGTAGTPFAISSLAAAVAGSYTSGPAARFAMAARGGTGDLSAGAAVFVSWTSLAPLVQVFTSAAADTETEASSVLGTGETYTSGYGSGASGIGTAHVSGGTGASPPAAPSALGDDVSQRLERILGYGGLPVPRAIDTATQPVQAALDVGGQQAGANVQAIVSSDAGWLTTDNPGLICYRSRPHLNADVPVWQLGPNVAAGQIPYEVSIGFGNDQQKTYTAITVAPYAPDGSSPADLVPSDAAEVDAAELQYGTRPLQVRSYLQSSTENQALADFLFSYYGTMRRRVETLVIDAARHPGAWILVASANLGDLCQVQDDPFGAPVTSGTYRISSLSRQIAGGANGSSTTAAITLVIDPVPPGGYFT
jgi:hypothetical protein